MREVHPFQIRDDGMKNRKHSVFCIVDREENNADFRVNRTKSVLLPGGAVCSHGFPRVRPRNEESSITRGPKSNSEGNRSFSKGEKMDVPITSRAKSILRWFSYWAWWNEWCACRKEQWSREGERNLEPRAHRHCSSSMKRFPSDTTRTRPDAS